MTQLGLQLPEVAERGHALHDKVSQRLKLLYEKKVVEIRQNCAKVDKGKQEI
jgi:hypothetical protein